MAQSLSVDLRRRVVAAVEAGMSRRQAAARFGVGVSSAIRWVSQSRMTGDLSPKPRGGLRPGRIEGHGDLVMAWVEAEPDLTLQEIAAKLEEAVGYRPPPSVVHGFFKRRGMTRKKKTAHAAEAGPAGCRTPASGLARRPARARPRAP